ncbi:hypothetical protein [Oligoflexus tunisiensis]|uniref:hypothetical protein n=1 Tax=Oligoflexus tunisiensis TaxID=708132 RepID=UPI00114C8687|nr:hypothetical protein [Oligoflexus tunisiensis]
MALFNYDIAGPSLICLMLCACGEDETKQSLQERFEAVYGYTDCQGATIGTALTQQTWTTVFHTYAAGYLRQTETTFLDEECKSSYTSLNRWATYSILSSSNEGTGEIHLEIKTRRVLSYTNENAPPELPGVSDINCNVEMGDDIRKEECKTYFDASSFVSRYVTLSLVAGGLQPFKDIDSAGTTEETRSTELAPYILSVLDPIDK